MNKSDIITRLFSDYAALRAYEIKQADARKALARQNDEFRSLDDELRSLSFNIAKKEAYGEDASALKKQADALNKKRTAALKAAGLSDKDFLPAVHCKKCNDTGLVEKGYCSCFKAKYVAELKKLCSLDGSADFKFSDCDFKRFKDAEHRRKIEFLYNTMQQYCNRFPNVKHKNILLMGGTGVGKTCLASAMANALLERGYSVMFLTAFDFNQLMLKYHTSPIAERGMYMDEVLDCDFLVIDDLGTEQMLKNVTEEYMFRVVSTRINRGKHTMFSTNLTLDKLRDFYGERIFSRMANQNGTYVRWLDGEDLRLN